MAHILVIDDEPNIRMMIRLTLQQDGHSVETASDGQEGLDKFGTGAEWDLVLLDQRMPVLEGLTVLQQIRYYDIHARVIMITAYGTVDLAVDAMKAGATDFLRKPFTAEILRGAVQAALRNGAGNESEALFYGLTFGLATLNGYRIESRPGAGINMGEDTGFLFTVYAPSGEARECTVVLSPVVKELIKAHADRESFPGDNRFWQALCEESLANYLYQNAAFLPDNLLRVDEFNAGLQRFVDAVLISV
jgi:CheY-like chemotaxis protein